MLERIKENQKQYKQTKKRKGSKITQKGDSKEKEKGESKKIYKGDKTVFNPMTKSHKREIYPKCYKDES